MVVMAIDAALPSAALPTQTPHAHSPAAERAGRAAATTAATSPGCGRSAVP